MTAKYQFIFDNNSDDYQRHSVRAQILFAKSADDVPDITKLLELDANGFYTDLSFYNGQEYKKYEWIKSLDCSQSYTQPTNRYPAAGQTGLTATPEAAGSGNINVSILGSSLNRAIFVKSKSGKVDIKMMFENFEENVEQMKPYLLLTSDVKKDGNGRHDPIAVSGQIRMTYVDN